MSRGSRLEVVCKKGVLKYFAKFTRKHLCQILFLNKVAGLRPATLLKNRFWHRCFSVNFAKFIRTPFLLYKQLWEMAAPLGNFSTDQEILANNLKVLEHESVFSKYSRNLNISEIFWTCNTKNNFAIIFPEYEKPHFLTSIEV